MVRRPETIQNAAVIVGADRFSSRKNPDDTSSLKYLVRLPLDNGVILKVRDTWPTTARVYCHPFDGAWPDHAELVADVPVVSLSSSFARERELVDAKIDGAISVGERIARPDPRRRSPRRRS